VKSAMIKGEEKADGQKATNGNAKVQIPIALPGILKEYAKAVLRSQPEDVIGWSAKYFGEVSHKGISSSTTQPEENLYHAIQSRVWDLYQDNQGALIDLAGCKALYAEFSGVNRIPTDELRTTWLSKGYSSTQLRELLAMGRMFASALDRDCFCAMICGTLGSTLRQTLRLFLEVASGVDNVRLQMIPFTKFEKICKFLIRLNDAPDEGMTEILDQCRKLSNNQEGMVTSQNLAEITTGTLDE